MSLIETAVGGLAAAHVPAARAIGAADEDIAPYISRSAHLAGGRFANPEPPGTGASADFGVVADMVRRPGAPRQPVLVSTPTFPREARALAATWLGHASVLVELDGIRILTDPVFSKRCSPSQWVGPARLHPSPVRVADLPTLDVVLISHDHYDHLDMHTVVEIARTQPDAVFVVPLGVTAHLVAWGIPADRIRQADWWETVEVPVPGGAREAGPSTLSLTCGPARHFSGRGLSRNPTLWASWAMVGPEHRVFFSGDTGYTERFAELGTRLGPFDLTLIAVGAYDPTWADIHVNPEEAVAIHRMLSGAAGTDAVMIPIHWGTFNLARHPWADPIIRLLPAAARNATTALVPQPGGTIDIVARTGSGLSVPDWWERSA
ncbi:MBL fold metallo-hydrolase [Gordonia sinesedis]